MPFPMSRHLDADFTARRRSLVAHSPHVYGLDRAELVRRDGAGCTVDVWFLVSSERRKPPLPTRLAPDQFSLRHLSDGRPYAAMRLRVHPDEPTRLSVDFPPWPSGPGGDATAIVELRRQEVDPLLAQAVIRPELGAARRSDPLPAPVEGDDGAFTDVNYLAKDFDSYRQLMLDHVSALQPDWRERHPADMTNAIVDVLAYAADALSYFQDAVATEAYLSMARRRVSLKRHARLLDYTVHEGCAARVWVQIRVEAPTVLKAGFPVVCDPAGSWGRDSIHVASLSSPPSDGTPVFETLLDTALHPNNERFEFYAWGAGDFVLKAGTTGAALVGEIATLSRGDVLILREMLDPLSGELDSGDPAKRHAVRLSSAPRTGVDPLTDTAFTQINWSAADALPFDLSVARASSGRTIDRISAAFGNVAPADVGFTLSEFYKAPLDPDEDVSITLQHRNLIYAQPMDPDEAVTTPAVWLGRTNPLKAAPAIEIVEPTVDGAFQTWLPVQDLLGADRFARVFVADTEADGRTTLRFGDNWNGATPMPGAQLKVTYRVGQPDSNVGADSISSWSPRPGSAFAADLAVTGVENPIAAGGGTVGPSAEQIRLHAPLDFRTQKRCVIAADYYEAVIADPRVTAVVTRDRWTGSWNTTVIYVQVDPTCGAEPAAVHDELAAVLAPLRIIGGAFRLEGPIYVPIDIAIDVAVGAPFAPVAVARAIESAIGAAYRFGSLSFGEPIFLSRIIGIAMAQPGVANVAARAFQRLGETDGSAIISGRLDFDPLEIPVIGNFGADGVRGRLQVTASAGTAP